MMNENVKGNKATRNELTENELENVAGGRLIVTLPDLVLPDPARED